MESYHMYVTWTVINKANFAEMNLNWNKDFGGVVVVLKQYVFKGYYEDSPCKLQPLMVEA